MNNNLQPLIDIAVIANLLTLLLYKHAVGQSGGTGTGMYFIYLEMPVLWLIALVNLTFFAIRLRKTIFSKPKLKWTILTMLFCTPIPMMVLYDLIHDIPTEPRSLLCK